MSIPLYMLTELNDNGKPVAKIGLNPELIWTVTAGPFERSTSIKTGIEQNKCVIVEGTPDEITSDLEMIRKFHNE